MTWTSVGLTVATGMIAYLLGRRKVMIIVVAAAGVTLISGFGVLAYRATHKQPERPVELALQLARSQWRRNEQPWYLLQIKNVGYQKVTIHDYFWADQDYLLQNQHGKSETHFEVVGPDGKPMEFSAYWGQHGEFAFWANECGGKVCEYDNNWHTFSADLKHGQTLTATPSMVAPLRKQYGQGLRDARIPPGATSAEQASYKKLWAMQGFSSYDPPERPLYSGYRVLEGYPFRKTGRYRMKVIYQPISTDYVEKMIREGDDWRGGLPPETRIYRFESNEVEFEVVP